MRIAGYAELGRRVGPCGTAYQRLEALSIMHVHMHITRLLPSMYSLLYDGAKIVWFVKYCILLLKSDDQVGTVIG